MSRSSSLPRLTSPQFSQRPPRSQVALDKLKRHSLGFWNKAKAKPNTNYTEHSVQYKGPNAAECIYQAQEGQCHNKIDKPIRHGGNAGRLAANVDRENLGN